MNPEQYKRQDGTGVILFFSGHDNFLKVGRPVVPVQVVSVQVDQVINESVLN